MNVAEAAGIDNLLYSSDVDFSCFADLAVVSPVDYRKKGEGSLMQVRAQALLTLRLLQWSAVLRAHATCAGCGVAAAATQRRQQGVERRRGHWPRRAWITDDVCAAKLA